MKRKRSLADRYPPSPPCGCETCLAYCRRPDDARDVPRSVGVLSPAFKGCEVDFAKEAFAARGCTFLADGRCELHGTGHQPLECRFCHHDRPGQGSRCHEDIGKDWNTAPGRALVVRWSKATFFLDRLKIAHRLK
jgi:hypothetical protein